MIGYWSLWAAAEEARAAAAQQQLRSVPQV